MVPAVSAASNDELFELCRDGKLFAVEAWFKGGGQPELSPKHRLFLSRGADTARNEPAETNWVSPEQLKRPRRKAAEKHNAERTNTAIESFIRKADCRAGGEGRRCSLQRITGFIETL
jgi:hypothetical protein